MLNIESAILEWRQRMLTSGIQAPVPLDELESHLRDHYQQLVSAGHSEAEALAIATTQLGDAPSLRREFSKVSRHRFLIWRDNPVPLNLIGLWLIIVGINASLSMRVWLRWDFSTPPVMLFGLAVTLLLTLQLIAGIGLILRSNFWRRFTIGWSGLSLGLFVFGLAWHFLTVSGGASPVESSLGIAVVGAHDEILEYYFLRIPLPMPFLHIISAVNVVALASGIYLLTRPPLRELFAAGRQIEKQLTTDN